MAAAACDTGKVKFEGLQAKASKQVNIDDEYEVKTGEKRWRIKVTGLLHSRVAYAEAIKYYLRYHPGGRNTTFAIPGSEFSYRQNGKARLGDQLKRRRKGFRMII